MVDEANSIVWEETDSVLEALVLEAHLIKKHQPTYNTKEKDNKSFSYVVISDEEFPRIVTIRGRELEKIESEEKKVISSNGTSSVNIVRKYGVKKMYGPFTSLATLKEGMKIIRKLFPYRDNKCIPKGKPCFNYQLGLCPGTCIEEVNKREYQRIVRNINLFFEGKKKKLVVTLKKEMNDYARKEMFEEAQKVRNTIWSLDHINDVSLMKREIKNTGTGEFRVEAYDVAHFGGKERVGVMTVVVNGEPDIAEYRKFNLKEEKGGDTGGLKEIMSRRFAHSEWQYPSLVVVDGSTAQINVAEKILEESGLPIPVVGVVKDEYHKPREILGDEEIVSQNEDAILKANGEAHRYAIAFHRKKRKLN